MQTFGVKDYINHTPSKHFTGKKMSKFKTPKNEKKIIMKCIQKRRCTASMYEQPLCKV